MTFKRILLSVALTGLLAGAAFVAREAEESGLRMVGAANRLLSSLTEEQKKKATFDFDDKERFRWFFTPQQAMKKPLRKGVPLSEMNDKQKDLARDLLRSSTSEIGYKRATTVMSLESILADLEKRGSIVRDPEWYFVAFFGSPSKTGKWGWRIEGHHLSLNFTVDGGKIVSATPFCLGANPAVVKSGPRKGTRALGDSEDDFRALFKLLDDDQRKAAQYVDKSGKPALLPEIKEAEPKSPHGKAAGLAVAKMNDEQKAAVKKLIQGYASRMPPEVAAHELAQLEKAGLDSVHLLYGGDPTPGKRYTYRVHGPTFVIEFLNEQSDPQKNVANHIHSVWRSIEGDFGMASR